MKKINKARIMTILEFKYQKYQQMLHNDKYTKKEKEVALLKKDAIEEVINAIAYEED